jgi:hypothetical protein
MPAPKIAPAVDVRIDVIESGDPKYPWKVRITTRDARGKLVGVRNLRAVTEADANERADRLRSVNEDRLA